MDMENIKAIMEWPTHRNVDEIISFMGLVGYYMWLIRNFSRISYPITSVQRKGKKFEWIVKYAPSFELLK